MAKEEILQKVFGYKTTFDKLKAHLQGHETALVLNEEEKRLLERWEAAFMMLKEHKNTADVRDMLVNTQGISRASAYSDIKNCQRLFGDVFKSNKDSLRHIITETANRLIMKAEMDGDTATVIAALNIIGRYNGLDQDDADLPDFSKLEPHTYIMNVSVEVSNFLLLMTQQGAVNLSDIRQLHDGKQ